MLIDRLVGSLVQDPGWQVLPAGRSTLAPGVTARAPRDLVLFLSRCGGVRRDGGVAIGTRIVHAQAAILYESDPADRSANWFVIAEEDESGTSERVVIDLDPVRHGRCYDAFWDCFGVAGSMPVVALSFTELLQRLIASGGEPYWADDDLALGDAYD